MKVQKIVGTYTHRGKQYVGEMARNCKGGIDVWLHRVGEDKAYRYCFNENARMTPGCITHAIELRLAEEAAKAQENPK